LYDISLSQVAPVTSVSLAPTTPSNLLVTTASLWFLSLVLSLGAALLGILIKQWMREYMRWTTIFPVQHAVHVRHYRYEDFRKWRCQSIVAFVSQCLEGALILFFVGLATLLWEVNESTAKVIAVSVGIGLTFALALSILPAIWVYCPYRTSFGSFLRHTPQFVLKTLIHLFALVLAPFVPPSDDDQTDEKYNSKTPVLVRLIRNVSQKILQASKLLKEKLPLAFQDHSSWIISDLSHRLPQDSEKTAIDKSKILVWLSAHRTVDGELMTQCISDLPGPPPVLLGRNEPQKEWLDRDQQLLPIRLKYSSYCQVLYGSMEFDHTLPDLKLPTQIDDLSGILKELLPTLPRPSTREDGPRPLPPHAFDEKIISQLCRSVQNLDEKFKYALSNCFVTLAENIFAGNSILDYDTEYWDLAIDFLRVLFLFSYRVPGSSTTSPESQGAVAKVDNCLQSAFTKLIAAGAPEVDSSGSRKCYDFFVVLLAIGTRRSLFETLSIYRFTCMYSNRLKFHPSLSETLISFPLK
jgi:hypothetical protein